MYGMFAILCLNYSKIHSETSEIIEVQESNQAYNLVYIVIDWQESNQAYNSVFIVLDWQLLI